MFQYKHCTTVSPSDTVYLNPPCSAFVVATSGNVKILSFYGNTQPGGFAEVGSSQIPYGASGPIAQIGPAGSYDSSPTTMYLD